MPEKKATYKIRVIHDGSNTINCCVNSLQEMSGSMYLTIYGEQRDTMKKPLTASVVSAVCVVHGVHLTSKCTLAGVKAEGNVLSSVMEGMGGRAGQRADPEGGRLHTQLCYGSLG